MVSSEELEEWAETAADDPDAVVGDVQTIVEGLQSEAAKDRNEAAKALSRIAKEHPDDVAAVRSQLLQTLTGDDHETVRYNAALTLWRIATEVPELLVESLETIVTGLSDEDIDVVEECGDILSAMDSEYPEEVSGSLERFLKELAEQTRAEESKTRKNAAYGFAVTASEFPDLVVAHLDSIAGLLDDDSLLVRFYAMMTFKRIATRQPATVSAWSESFARGLSDDNEDVRELAARGLAAIAGESPSEAVDNIDEIVILLTDDGGEVRFEAARTLQAIAMEYPEEVAPHAGALVSVLNRGPRDAVEAVRVTLHSLVDVDESVVDNALKDVDFEYEVEEGEGIHAAIDAAVEAAQEFNDTGDLESGGLSELLTTVREKRQKRNELIGQLSDAVDRLSESVTDIGDVSADPDYESDPAVVEPVTQPDDECAYARDLGLDTWSCDRDPVDDQDYCLFHAPIDEKDDDEVVDELIEITNSEGRASKELLGARFGELDLANVILDAPDNHPIDLRHAYVAGDLEAPQLTVGQPFKTNELTVVGQANFRLGTFESPTDFNDAEFGAASFEMTSFRDIASFENVRFAGDAGFELSSFEGIAQFSESTFERGVQYNNATFSSIAYFNDITIEDDANFNLSTFQLLQCQNTSIRGDLNLRSTTFEQDLKIDETEIEGRFHAYKISISGTLSAENLSVGGELKLRNGSLRGVAMLGGIDVAGAVKAEKLSLLTLSLSDFTIGGELNLAGVNARGELNLKEGTIGGDLTLNVSRFESKCIIINTWVKGDLNAHNCHWADTFTTNGSTVGGDADFDLSTFESEFWMKSSKIEGYSQFFNTNFQDMALFDETTFHGEATFDEASFDTRVRFDDVRFRGQNSFDGATIASGNFERVTADSGQVDMTNVSFSAGTIVLPDDELVIFNFQEATVGDVELRRSGDRQGPLFDRFLFLNTRFDGFDFGPYRGELTELGWEIHTVTDEATVDVYERAELEWISTTIAGVEPGSADDLLQDNDIDLNSDTLEDILDYDDSEELLRLFRPLQSVIEIQPGDIENTYLKAKNGADQVGDRKAAAEFFIHQLHNRRYGYVRIVNDSDASPRDRVSAAGSWIGNYLLHQTCGYGERIWRVGYVSSIVIIVFALIYTLFSKGTQSGDVTTGSLDSVGTLFTAEGADVLVNNLYFSIVTFTTLGYGDIQPVGTTARYLAGMESFLGAFLLALVVFVFGRRVSW